MCPEHVFMVYFPDRTQNALSAVQFGSHHCAEVMSLCGPADLVCRFLPLGMQTITSFSLPSDLFHILPVFKLYI